ncbi:hypothetical protein KR018_008718 [Drosophila ironensis]|nr:hypothetical protein KR018_008718 [Drosophila ironensis]
MEHDNDCYHVVNEKFHKICVGDYKRKGPSGELTDTCNVRHLYAIYRMNTNPNIYFLSMGGRRLLYMSHIFIDSYMQILDENKKRIYEYDSRLSCVHRPLPFVRRLVYDCEKWPNAPSVELTVFHIDTLPTQLPTNGGTMFYWNWLFCLILVLLYWLK